jgi:hypothetical protein
MPLSLLVTSLSSEPLFQMAHSVSGVPPSGTPIKDRRSFGERAILRINTMYHDLSPIPPKGHLEPRAGNLPRRRITSDKTIRKVSDTTVKELGASQDRKTVNDMSSIAEKPQDKHYFQGLVPSLFVAFADHGDHDRVKQLQEVCGEAFTHIVSISSEPRNSDTMSMAERTVDVNGTQRLHLAVPRNDNDDGQTILTSSQLLAGRDFLSLAMPRSYHLPHAPGEYPAVCILITTSPNRPTDAMSVAACYLAYESGNTVHTVLECINGEEDIFGTWRGVISRDGIDLVENVARS